MKNKLATVILGALFSAVLGLNYLPTTALAAEGVIFKGALHYLNSVEVYKIIKVHDVEDIRQAFKEAQTKGLKISIAGKRHAQGGQQSYPNGIVLDMLDFNKIISLDTKQKTIRIQSGATWKQIQDYIRPYGYAVKAIQMKDIFTIGGSLSSNIHGDDPNYGSIIESVTSFHLMLANGKVINVSRRDHPELFRLVIGGYGLFGIILDVDLSLTENAVYKTNTVYMDYTKYPAFFQSHILNNDQIGAHYAEFIKTKEGDVRILEVTTLSKVNMSVKSLSQLPKRERKKLTVRDDRYADKMAGYKGPVESLIPEYFIPINQFVFFIDNVKGILESFEAISKPDHIMDARLHFVRYAKKDKESFLPYAKTDSFAVGIEIYIDQPLSAQGIKDVQHFNSQIIDLTLHCGGTYFLTKMAIYPDKAQLLKAYPAFNEFIRKKRKYDPHEIFMSQFYDHYR